MFELILPKNLKNKKARRQEYQNIEPQEVFLDNLAKKEEDKLGISQRKLEVLLSHKMLRLFQIFSFLIISGLFIKTFQLQVLNYNEYLAKAKENKFVSKSLEASRGVIYDSKGEQLVFNLPSFDLVADKRKLPQKKDERESLLKTVAQIIKEDYKSLEKKISDSKEYLLIVKENLDQQALIILNTKTEELPGFEIQKNSVRDYKDGQDFSHIIGYMGRVNLEELKSGKGFYSSFDYIGRDGLEKQYEDVLKKNPGELQIEKDVLGNVISKEVVALPDSGNSLVLSVNYAFQKKIIEEIKKTLENIGGKRAAVVALNPKTGAVLALASFPSYDNNVFAKGIDYSEIKTVLEDTSHPLYNRVIAGQYAVGSTIKPLTASAALQENLIDPNKDINCLGKIVIPNQYNPQIVYTYNDWREHGIVDMRKAIAESCNVYFYTIGGGYKSQKGLGPSLIKKYLDLFGWEKKSGIDLPGEIAGFIPSPAWKKEQKKEPWVDGDTYNISIGQGDLKITPIEVATAFMAIANKGEIYKPQITQKIIDSDKKTVKEFLPELIASNFIKKDNLEVVREGMRNAVTGENAPHASSVLLNSLPVEAAAKTGTAQTSTPNHYNNWITVFAPYDDPEIVLTIMLENVPTQAATLLPAREILQWYFTNK